MILAEDEVQAGVGHAGTMVLGDGSRREPRSPTSSRSTTTSWSSEITPNRPDCLGVYGVAREVHAVTGAAARPAAVGRRPRRGRPSGPRPPA